MHKNYIKTAWRNLKKNVLFSFINILGLGVGIACFLLFLLFALNEFNYNRFNANADNIYRVYEWMDGIEGRAPQGIASAYTPLGPAMKSDFADVENFTRINKYGEKFVKIRGETTQGEISFADPQLFKMFSFKILEGNAINTLMDPNNLVITKSEALRLFGMEDVIGQTIEIKIENDFVPFNISAVTENLPSNSSIQFTILGSYEYLLSTAMGRHTVNNWNMTIGSETYVQLTEGSDLMTGQNRLKI